MSGVGVTKIFVTGITQEKVMKRGAHGGQWALFQKCKFATSKRIFLNVFLLVEWVGHKETAASSFEHWKPFVLGDIEIMVLSCQCETLFLQ